MTNMQLAYSQHLEQVRHNKQTEAVSAGQLEETVRHNWNTEILSAKDLEEKIRHQQAQDTESARHNKVTEAEIMRHNQATENIARTENSLKKYLGELNATVTRANAVDKWQLDRMIAGVQAETQRLATAVNAETSRYATDKSYQQKQLELQATWAKIDNELLKIQNDYDVNQKKIDTDRIQHTNTLFYDAFESVGSIVQYWKNALTKPMRKGSSNQTTYTTAK